MLILDYAQGGWKMKIGINVDEIMEKDFPIVDASLSIETCIKKLNDKHEGCMVMKNGYFYSVLGYEDLLKTFLDRKQSKSIKDMKIEKKFEIIDPEADISEAIELMSKNVDFLVVRDRQNILGLVTKKEITEIEPLLFVK